MKKRKREKGDENDDDLLVRDSKKRNISKKVTKSDILDPTVEEKFGKLFENIKLSKKGVLSLIKGEYYDKDKIRKHSKAMNCYNVVLNCLDDEIEEIDGDYDLSSFFEEFEKEINGSIVKDVAKEIIENLYKKGLGFLNDKKGVYQYIIYHRGTCYGSMGDFKSSLNDLSKAIELNSKSKGDKDLLADMYNNRGNTFLEMKEYSKCLNDSNKAVELIPNDSDLFFNKGVCYSKMNMNKEALHWYDKAIVLNPNDDSYYYNKGVCCSKMNMKKEALHWYDKAIALNPNDDSYYYNKGVCYEKMNMNREAIQSYSKAIELNPNDDSFYYNKGICYEKMNMFNEAIKCFDKTIEIKPSWDSYWIKGDLLQKTNKLIEGIFCYTKAINTFNNDDDVIEDYEALEVIKDERENSYFKLKKKVLFGVNFNFELIDIKWDMFNLISEFERQFGN